MQHCCSLTNSLFNQEANPEFLDAISPTNECQASVRAGTRSLFRGARRLFGSTKIRGCIGVLKFGFRFVCSFPSIATFLGTRQSRRREKVEQSEFMAAGWFISLDSKHFPFLPLTQPVVEIPPGHGLEAVWCFLLWRFWLPCLRYAIPVIIHKA